MRGVSNAGQAPSGSTNPKNHPREILCGSGFRPATEMKDERFGSIFYSPKSVLAGIVIEWLSPVVGPLLLSKGKL